MPASAVWQVGSVLPHLPWAALPATPTCSLPVPQVNPDLSLGSVNIGSLQDSEDNDQDENSGRRLQQDVTIDPSVTVDPTVSACSALSHGGKSQECWPCQPGMDQGLRQAVRGAGGPHHRRWVNQRGLPAGLAEQQRVDWQETAPSKTLLSQPAALLTKAASSLSACLLTVSQHPPCSSDLPDLRGALLMLLHD